MSDTGKTEQSAAQSRVSRPGRFGEFLATQGGYHPGDLLCQRYGDAWDAGEDDAHLAVGFG